MFRNAPELCVLCFALVILSASNTHKHITFCKTKMPSCVLIVFLLVATGGLAQSPFPWDCRKNGVNCDVCLGYADCGWCSYSGRCESGNATGSDSGCLAPYWTWSASNCPATPRPTSDTCRSNGDCTSCTLAESCGWCTYSGRCELGNATGSFDGCTAPYWDWASTECPASNDSTPVPTPSSTSSPWTPAPPVVCHSYTSCADCAGVVSCGWCNYTGTCESGSPEGSFSGCVDPYWSWYTNVCPAPSPPSPPIPTVGGCGSAQDCLSCTGLGGCGWCSFNQACEPGNMTASAEGCDGIFWSWMYNECPASGSSSQH
ncbi:Hypothetical protein, putative [Bodo saltans]|uniref:PSI domain-containing protein n=1 Tax=Bodo saltans TaxID=75058 RepID=A0A0S4INJ8_BODSA|nr:Hypothetical protein, putative [Bodo saltans]|eukprot:CUE87126.1 Hypothetical protein, putative [Bodo saltans]